MLGWLQELDKKVRDVLNPSIESRRERHKERMEILQQKLKEQKVKEQIFDSRHAISVKREELRSKRNPTNGEVKELPEFSDVLFGPSQVKPRGEKPWSQK